MSEKRKDKTIFGRWQVVITIVLAATSLFIGHYWGSRESDEQLEHWRTQAKYWQTQSGQAQRALEYSMEPKCDLEFVPGSISRSTSPYFLLTNHGPGRLDNVWLKETVFLLDKEGAHECPNFPHFEYKRYNGSASSMGSLDLGGERRIEVHKCLLKAAEMLFQKFSGTLVSRFRLTGNALASPEFRRDLFFVLDEKTSEWGVPTYRPPHEHVGGSDLVDSVVTYLNEGPQSLIELVSIQDFHEFFRNPPQTFYKTKDGGFLPYDGTTHVPSGTPLVPRARLFESVGSGSLKLGWRCDGEVTPIYLNSVSQPGIW